MRKLFIIFVSFLLPFMIFFMFLRASNGLTPFFSSSAILNYLEGFEPFARVKESFDLFLFSLQDLEIILNSFEISTSTTSDFIEQIVYFFRSTWNVLVGLVNVLISSFRILINLISDLVYILSWLFGFFPYVLSF